MLYIKLILRKKPIFNIKFKYVNNIVILRTGLITFYITAVLITDIKDIFK